MALTDVQTAFFRAKLGTRTDMTDVETRLTRLGDQFLVVVEVLEERLSTLTSGPLSFSVPEYSENNSGNVDALRKALASAQQDAAAGEDVPDPMSTVRIVSPVYATR